MLIRTIVKLESDILDLRYFLHQQCLDTFGPNANRSKRKQLLRYFEFEVGNTEDRFFEEVMPLRLRYRQFYDPAGNPLTTFTLFTNTFKNCIKRAMNWGTALTLKQVRLDQFMITH